MKDYNYKIAPRLDDNSKENFDKTTEFMKYLYEQSKNATTKDERFINKENDTNDSSK